MIAEGQDEREKGMKRDDTARVRKENYCQRFNWDPHEEMMGWRCSFYTWCLAYVAGIETTW